MKNLKPVIFIGGDKQFYHPNYYAQTILLKSMSEGVTDPNELRKIAGLKTVADVYRTLDKLALRKEYHEALARQGVSFDEIISGIKQICEGSSSDSVRLKGYQTLLRSLGLDKYEKQEESGKDWEEMIIEAMERRGKTAEMITGEVEVIDYEVERPETPASELKRKEEEKKLADELYGK
jgi:hypothetical protein